MDGYLDSLKHSEEALKVSTDIREILNLGEFKLTKVLSQVNFFKLKCVRQLRIISGHRNQNLRLN